MKHDYLFYIILIFGSLIVASILSIILRKILNTVIKKLTIKLKSDPTNFSFIKNSLSFLIYTAAIIFIFYTKERLS